MSVARLNAVLKDNGLTDRECEVSYLVSQGGTNQEIADDLEVAEVTVKFHLQNIFKKLEIKNRAALIVFCVPHIVFPELSKKPKRKLKNWINPDADDTPEREITARSTAKKRASK